MVTPAPGPGQSAQVTSNYFDNMGRVWQVKLPDNSIVTFRRDDLAIVARADRTN